MIKQVVLCVGVSLGISALYFHLIGPAIAGAMAAKPPAV